MTFKPPAKLFKRIQESANATLVFDIAADGGATDPATGNYLPDIEQVTVKAKIKQSTDRTQVNIGVNQDIVMVTGWFTCPTKAPATIKHGMKVSCTVDGVSGSLEFMQPIQNALVSSAIASGSWGEKFMGKFRRDV